MCSSVVRADDLEDAPKPSQNKKTYSLEYILKLGSDLEDAKKAYEKKDYVQAQKIFRPLAEEGVASAQYHIGLMYFNGEGVTRDYHKAVKFLRLSAEQGNEFAQIKIGWLYFDGNNRSLFDKRYHY